MSESSVRGPDLVRWSGTGLCQRRRRRWRTHVLRHVARNYLGLARSGRTGNYSGPQPGRGEQAAQHTRSKACRTGLRRQYKPRARRISCRSHNQSSTVARASTWCGGNFGGRRNRRPILRPRDWISGLSLRRSRDRSRVPDASNSYNTRQPRKISLGAGVDLKAARDHARPKRSFTRWPSLVGRFSSGLFRSANSSAALFRRLVGVTGSRRVPWRSGLSLSIGSRSILAIS
jgi:hypothetical protein